VKVLFMIALVGLVLGFGDRAPVRASTATPSPTPTATTTPFITLEVNQFWTLPASTNDAGTPVPSQPVSFGYSATAGDVAISVLEAAIVISLWGISIIWLLTKRGGNS
jgi:hypothetical protein